MNKCVNYVLTTPWPKVTSQPNNRPLVRALFSLYAGPESELSSITQYFYDSLLTGADGYPDLSDLFGCVSRTGMIHLEQLGKLILAYGGDPRLLSYRGDRPQWWSSGYLTYGRAPRAMLEQAIAGERRAVEGYRAIAGRMSAEPRAVIQRIIDDERHHIELFERAAAQLPREAPRSRPVPLPHMRR